MKYLHNLALKVIFLSISVHISAQYWNFELGGAKQLYPPVNFPGNVFYYMPDGHISVIPDSTDKFIMFWAEFESYRTTGTKPFPENQNMLDPTNPIIGGRIQKDTFYCNGIWLYSVYRLLGDSLIGFAHCEDTWWPQSNPGGIAWKSIGVVYSSDNGKSWTLPLQILTTNDIKPPSPVWGGLGDFCVIRDSLNNRWICYYQHSYLSMAVSYDINASPGTWYKYYNAGFTEPGLAGKDETLPGLGAFSGGNPSIHWNYFLNKWIMIWHTWQPEEIYITASIDGIHWEFPKRVIRKVLNDHRYWYPTIIGNNDKYAGSDANLYYADIFPNYSRYFMAVPIVFEKVVLQSNREDYSIKDIHLSDSTDNDFSSNYSGNYLLVGNGKMVNSSNDNFRYSYWKRNDLAEIKARMTIFNSSAQISYGGLMIRDNLSTGAKFISSLYTTERKAGEFFRLQENASSFSFRFNQYSNPVWLRITRDGNLFSTYISEDTLSWIKIDYRNIEMGDTVFAGLTGCSELSDSTLFLFDHITIKTGTSNSIEALNTNYYNIKVQYNRDLREICFQNVPAKSIVNIYDITGKYLFTSGNSEGTFSVYAPISKGIVLISVKQSRTIFTTKLAIF